MDGRRRCPEVDVTTDGRREVRRWRRPGVTGSLLAAAALLLLQDAVGAQELSYSRGQTISPAYEGWVEKPDGSRAFLFGYMNRNWQEQPDIPVGPNNNFSPGPAERGQPTHFLPRRNRFVFEVPVPDDFDEDNELVWTLVIHGGTRVAYASMRPDYFLDNVTIMSEGGALGGGGSTPEERANRPPEVELEGATLRQVRVGEPLTLSVLVTDDGVPEPPSPEALERANPITDQGTLDLEKILRKPSYGTVNKVNALHHSWFVYHQPSGAEVTFDPPQIAVWEDVRPWTNSPWADYWAPPDLPEDDRWVARVTFGLPGTYVLHGRADDGGLSTDVAVRIEVTP